MRLRSAIDCEAGPFSNYFLIIFFFPCGSVTSTVSIELEEADHGRTLLTVRRWLLLPCCCLVVALLLL